MSMENIEYHQVLDNAVPIEEETSQTKSGNKIKSLPYVVGIFYFDGMMAPSTGYFWKT